MLTSQLRGQSTCLGCGRSDIQFHPVGQRGRKDLTRSLPPLSLLATDYGIFSCEAPSASPAEAVPLWINNERVIGAGGLDSGLPPPRWAP